MWIKMDKETSAGHQIDAIEQPTGEIEWNGTNSISYKPPTAYKTLNPTQNSTIRGKFELPRALIFITLFTITPRQDYGLNFNSKTNSSTSIFQESPDSYNTPLPIIWK